MEEQNQSEDAAVETPAEVTDPTAVEDSKPDTGDEAESAEKKEDGEGEGESKEKEPEPEPEKPLSQLLKDMALAGGALILASTDW